MTYKYEIKANGKQFEFGEFIFDSREACKLADRLQREFGNVEVIVSRRPGETEGAYKWWMTVSRKRFQDMPKGYLKRP